MGLHLHLESFEMHRWHLPLRLGVTTGKTTTSDPKAFPKRLAPERGNSMASSRTPFFDLRWNDLQCQTLRPELKKKGFRSCGAQFALPIAFEMRRAKPRLLTQKPFPKKARPGTHGLAGSRTPFFDLRWNDLQCQTLRPEPIKKEDYTALGLNLHLQLPSKCTVGTFRCVWASRRAKPRLLTQKPCQEGSPRTGKQHGLASSRTPFFDLRWNDLQCQTLRPEPIKKEAFEMHRWHLLLRLGVDGQNHDF